MIKKILLLVFFFSAFYATQAQTIVYSEDFEGTLKLTSGGTPAWALNSTLQHGGINSYHGTLDVGDTSWFYTDVFATTGNSFVILDFSHICKIEFFDAGIIEVSTDGGNNWTMLTETEYMGSGTFSALSGNKFTAVAYGTDWQVSTNTATPTNSWWKDEAFDISTSAGNQAQVQIRFKLYDGNSTGANGNYGWLVDDIIVTASASELIAPVITMQTPIIQGSVYGTGPFDIYADITDGTGIDTAYMIYTINGGIADTIGMSFNGGVEYYSTIPAANVGDTICYFLETIDASPAANTTQEPNGSCYQIILNNNLPTYCDTTPISSFVWLETFDNYLDSVEEGNWDNLDSGDDIDWTLLSGATSSINTGPDEDHTSGNGNYIYLEASGNYNKTAYLVSQCIDLTALDNPELEFWYHMYGTNIDELHLDIYYGGQWIQDIMTTLSGNQGNQWLKQEVDLTSYKNDIIMLRFRGSTGSSFYADMALDDISIYDKKDDDVYVYDVLTPTSTKCQLSTAESVSVVVKNIGANSQDTIPLAYQVNSGTIVRDTLFSTITSGSVDTFTFSTTSDMSVAGTYTINVWTEMPTDQYINNDTLWNYQAISGTGISSFPSTEDFDSFTKGSPGTLLNDWTNSTDDNHDWYVYNFKTPSTNTGPDEDHTSGNGMYMYIEATGYYNDTASLQSACHNLSALNSAIVEFYYHMFGDDMGSLHLDVIQDGITYTDVMTPISGDQGDIWWKKEVDLSSYTGNIMLQFRGVVGSGTYSDMAIDDVTIRDKQLNDVSVLSIDAPFNPCGTSTLDPITISVVNAGIDAQTNIPVYYSVNGGSPVSDMIQGVINAGDTTSFTFATQYNFSSITTYYITVWTALSTDTNYTNDSIVNYEFSTASAVTSFPFIEDFEGFVKNSTTMYNDWTNESDDNMDWLAYQGATSSTLTGPDADHTSGSGLYLYLESSGNYNEEAVLTSPCFNISSLPNPTLEFWYHMYGSSMGELHVDLFYNGGWNNDVITPIKGDQGNAWLKNQMSLSSYTGSIQIRFRGITGSNFYSDLAIDDIKIFERPKNDVGVASIDVNQVGCDFTAVEYITVSVVNYGGDPQAGIPIYYSINGGTPIIENVTTYMNSDDTITFTFSTTADLNAEGDYYISCWTALPNDTTSSNDSVANFLVSSYEPYVDFPFVQDFESFLKSTPSLMKEGWYNDPDDDEEWRVHSGSSSTYSTGPSYDHTTGAGKYIYINSDSAYGSTEVNLVSPCIDISSLSSPSIGFWYHMYGSSMGSLYVDVYYNGSWTNSLTSLSGNKGDSWFYKEVNLSSYPGIVQIRFRGKTGTSYYSDMALDDISILPSLSAGSDSLYAQSESYSLPLEDSTEFNVRIINSGRTTLTKVSLTLSIDGNQIATELLSLSPVLKELQTKDYTLQTKYYLTPGMHDICIWSSAPNLSTDGFTTDDTICIQYTVFDTVAQYPYCNNFDTGLNEWASINAYNFKTGNISWQEGTPNQTHITGAYSGTNAWMTGLESDYLSLDSSGLFTPLFVVQKDQCYHLSFYHNFYTEQFQDGGIVEYSTDGGTNWGVLGQAFETNWMNSDYVSALNPIDPSAGWTGNSGGWIYAEHDFKAPTDGQTIFRFRFGSDYSVQYDGWAIDDFCFEEVSTPCDFSEIEEIDRQNIFIYDAVPNPAKDQTQISYYLPNAEEINISITNLLGEIIYLQNQDASSGKHTLNINVNNWPAGVYYYSLQADKQQAVKKLIVIK